MSEERTPSADRGTESHSSDLTGRVAIVSGVGPGLGRESALTLAAAGANVGLGARSQLALNEVADDVIALGRRSVTRTTDVTSFEQCQALVADVLTSLGRIDVLVNNAFSALPWQLFEESNLDDWRDAMEINYWGSLNMTRAVLPAMTQAGGGSIVMINTMYTRVAVPRYGAYDGSKGALETITRLLARELGPKRIRVNGVHPGPMYSRRFQRSVEQLAVAQQSTAEAVLADFTDRTCLGTLPTPREVAGTVLFLASDLSLPVTGQALHVNAGDWLS